MTTRLSSSRNFISSILFDTSYFWLLGSLVILCDVLLTQFIIRFVPYTEIDWETYMTHIQLYLKGERDYSKITGPTGPLVYPAGHVYIHNFLYLITESGTNVAFAQQIYGFLYILSLFLMCGIYYQAGAPNWTVLFLPLSKRLHSIFVLRLFNDCWSLVVIEGAVLAYQNELDDLGTLLLSAALAVKMSILLYLPGVLVILFKRRGLLSTLRHLATITISQIIMATPFLRENGWAYVHYSFDISRVFLYKWTVNWRFVDEEIFLSSRWAKGLLVGHVCTLIVFGLFRWCRRDGGVWRLLERGLRKPTLPASFILLSPDYVATVLFTSNLIGILFARSLHYQFYSWYAQQVPFLASRTRYSLVLKVGIMLGIEYAWNIFPSTQISSAVLLLANSFLLAGVWFGDSEGKYGQ